MPPAQPTEAEVLAYIDSLDAAEQDKFFQLAAIVRKYEPIDTMPAPEADPTDGDDLNTLPTWGEMSVRRFEPEALALIPQAIQTISLLMSEALMSFYDEDMNGDDWCDAFGMAVHTIAHAMARVRTGSMIVDIHAWGKQWR